MKNLKRLENLLHQNEADNSKRKLVVTEDGNELLVKYNPDGRHFSIARPSSYESGTISIFFVSDEDMTSFKKNMLSAINEVMKDK